MIKKYVKQCIDIAGSVQACGGGVNGQHYFLSEAAGLKWRSFQNHPAERGYYIPEKMAEFPLFPAENRSSRRCSCRQNSKKGRMSREKSEYQILLSSDNAYHESSIRRPLAAGEAYSSPVRMDRKRESQFRFFRHNSLFECSWVSVLYIMKILWMMEIGKNY